MNPGRRLLLGDAFLLLSFLILAIAWPTTESQQHAPKPEMDDRKRIKFGPIRSPFVSDVGTNEEEEETEEDDLNLRRSRTNVLYFLISSFANASDNLKTLVKFLLTSNQLILVGWISFIIAIFVLSYLITINPIGSSTSSIADSELLLKENEIEPGTDKPDGAESGSALEELQPKDTPAETSLPRPCNEFNKDRILKSLINIFNSEAFKGRLDQTLLDCIQGDVHILDEENECKILDELSIDYPPPEKYMVITGRAQDFKRTFLFENNVYWILKNIKFTIESKDRKEYIFKIPFDGNEMIFEKQCKDLVQSYFVSLDVSEEMEAHFIVPYRQKSSLIRSHGDNLLVEVLKLTGAPSELLHISLSIDEPSPQILHSNIYPFQTQNSDCIWNTQFMLAISPFKSKKLLIEVTEENGVSIGSAKICTSDLHLIPNQIHSLPLLHPSKSTPKPYFLSVQLSYNFSSSHSTQKAQEGGFYVNKILDSSLTANQLTYKTSYILRDISSRKSEGLSASEDKGNNSTSSLVANAALNNLLGVENSTASTLPFKSTMLITSVQRIPSIKADNARKVRDTSIPLISSHDNKSSSSHLNGSMEDKKSSEMDNEEQSNETELSIESIPMSPSSQHVKITSRSKSNFPSLNVPNPMKKSKENFISSLKRIISGPSLYSIDGRSPRPRLYSSPSQLGRKSVLSPSSISLKSLTKDLLSSRLNLRSNQVNHSSDIGYSSNSDSEFSLELKSDWRGPRSLSWESWDSGASYLLLPGEGEGSSMSDVSGVSGTSFAAGSNGNVVKKGGRSLLVFETKEYGLLRHYLIPHKKGGTRLSKRQGSKLHVFNNHVFIAKHIKRGMHCSVCKKRIILRLGKQGYACRDCGKICHKQCHEKVEDVCMKSTFPSMELFRGSTIMKRKEK